jgi:broad specificity phosphatase PhoE
MGAPAAGINPQRGWLSCRGLAQWGSSVDVLYLVRHGQTEWNRERRMQGRLDSPLTETGRAHAHSHAELLAAERIEYLLASPLGRARATAGVVGAACGIEATIDERLAERSYGAWEGLTQHEIEADHAAEWEAHVRDAFHHRPPGGENVPDVMLRVAPLLDALPALPYRRIAIVSHGICGRALLTRLLALDPRRASTARQPNDVVYRLDFAAPTVRCEHFRAGAGPHPGLFTSRP